MLEYDCLLYVMTFGHPSSTRTPNWAPCSMIGSHFTFPCRIHLPPFDVHLRSRGRSLLVLDHTHHDTRLVPVHLIYHAWYTVSQCAPREKYGTEAPSPILPTLLEPGVKIRSYNSLIQLGTTNVFHAVQCVLMIVVLNETKAAGCLVKSIQPHHQSLDLPTPVSYQQCILIKPIGLNTWQTTHVFVPL